MTVEVIEAIGTHIVIPICAFGCMGLIFYCMFKD
jgi:hypothetical protein